MPRPKRITPNRHWHTTIPEDLAARVDFLLYSELESGVPRGAIQELVVGLLQAFFDNKQFDLNVLLPLDMAKDSVVSAKIGTIAKFITWFNSHNHLRKVDDPS